MTGWQLISIGVFIALMLNKQSRYAAMVMLVFNLIYFTFIIDLHWSVYYHWSATLNTVLALTIYSRYKAVAILSFLLIPINVLGYELCKNYYEPDIYDNICMLIILLQIIILISRCISHGVDGRNRIGFMVFIADFDSGQNRVKIQKTPQK